MNDLLVRELRSGDESLWLALDDCTVADGESTESDRRAEFLKLFEERSAEDPRTFLIALDGTRPAGRLEGIFLDKETYFVRELRVAEGFSVSVVEDALAGYLADSFGRDGVGVFSSDRPRNVEINSALERAGFKVEKKKAYVARNLTGELPVPGVAFTYRALADFGRGEFIRLLTAASEGDPFEDADERDPEAEFDELVEMAADKYDDESWFAAIVDGEVVGVVLPQEFADADAEGTLFYVAILPSFRGRGYGRALHAAGLSMLKDRGLTKYIGSTDTRNEPMLRVFEANGCPQTSTQFFYRPPSPPSR
jgi:RimJ/RimL family protein N-acetyltransferase